MPQPVLRAADRTAQMLRHGSGFDVLVMRDEILIFSCRERRAVVHMRNDPTFAACAQGLNIAAICRASSNGILAI